MESNRERFLELRAEEFPTLYDASFTKKEAQKQGVKLVVDVMEAGDINKMPFIANLARLNEVISCAMAEARKYIDEEKQTVMGVEFTPVNGGNTINYKDDEIWLELQGQMKHRESLLKVALNSDIEFYDEKGVLVPKVSTSPRASSFTIKF